MRTTRQKSNNDEVEQYRIADAVFTALPGELEFGTCLEIADLAQITRMADNLAKSAPDNEIAQGIARRIRGMLR